MVANIGPTQTAVTNAFQSGIGSNNDRVGTAEQVPRTNQIQPREAPTSETQRLEDRSLARQDEQTSRSDNATDSRGQEDAPRGSLLDIEA